MERIVTLFYKKKHVLYTKLLSYPSCYKEAIGRQIALIMESVAGQNLRIKLCIT